MRNLFIVRKKKSLMLVDRTPQYKRHFQPKKNVGKALTSFRRSFL
jgi:hypothetical protein